MISLTGCGKISARFGSIARNAVCTVFVTVSGGNELPHSDGEKWKIFLGERPIKFHVIVLIESHGTHIAHHTNNLDRHATAGDEQRFSNRVFVCQITFLLQMR